MATKGWAIFASAVISMAALVSCGPRQSAGPFAPRGEPAGATAVDPMLVGHRLMAAGEYELALQSYIRAAAQQGPTVDVLSSLGTAELKLGRLNQAEKTLRRAVQVDNSFVPAWNNLGAVLMAERKYAEARLVFETAYKIDGGRTDAIAENLRLALAKSKNPSYGSDVEMNYSCCDAEPGRTSWKA